MFSPQYLENCGISPTTRFLTSYTKDFRPFHEHYPQSTRGIWSDYYGDFYKLSSQPFRSGYNRSQVSDSTLPVVTRPFNLPNLREVTLGIGYAPANAWTQQITIPKETALALWEDYVWGEKGNMWKQQEPQQIPDPLFDKGMLVWASRLDGISCEDFLKSYFKRDRRLHPLLTPPTELSPNIISRDVEDRKQRGILWDYSRSTGVKNHPYHQPPFTKCSCCGVEYEHPRHTVDRCRFPPQSHVPPIHHSMEYWHAPYQTEHQASYNAPWFQPKNQRGIFLHH